jgi:uncharacterized protein YyaL (SSP411 family)
MPNRLARETSPYLQQHAGNPVEWYPWGAEALERARAEAKPLLLSIGYSACHWCHVMARESFEDAAVAAVMNRLFVNVKVDREERPDLDQIYQTAHQMLAQRGGGWPLTMFLTPDGTPFFGGTYFPKEARYGLPGFAELCERIGAIWRERQADIAAQNVELLQAFERTLPRPQAATDALSDAPIRGLLESLRRSFDARHGGFGGAPKFPHPSDLEFCLRQGETRIVEATLTGMCEGGIYDQLGGGFCRYSVDAAWAIPHFEKMLYDNGPLLQLLADAFVVLGKPLYRRCAEETAGWLLREMQSPEGAYYSSLDADSEHEEGKYYVWQRDEVRDLLSDEEYRALAPHYGLEGPPNFENRAWHLRVVQPVASNGEALREAGRRKLLAERERRARPGRDEKILVSWNALAIRGMLRAARVFGRADWQASAERALAFVREHMWKEGRLLATYKDGRAHLSAYLDDYAFLLAALIERLQSAYRADDLRFAQALADVLLEQFEDAQAGGFFFTARDAERLIHRPKPGHDQATPSGNAMAAWGLSRLGAITGEARYANAAERTLALFHPFMCEHPEGFATMACTLEEALRPSSLLVLRGPQSALAAWQAELAREYLPRATVLAIGDQAEPLPEPLDKPLGGRVAAWLCSGAACLPPMHDLAQLKERLEAERAIR